MPMMHHSALLFPGQGSQSVGMACDFYDRYATVKRLFAQASEVVRFDLAKVCFEGPANRLEQTDVQQPAIFTVSAAVLACLEEIGRPVSSFQFAAGLSLGEYTALYAAGSFSFRDGVRLVHRRGQLMQSAADAHPGGMASLIGADEASALRLCEEARGNEVLVPANFNCPGQVVISGDKAACQRAMGLSEKHGFRAVALPVAGAFHSPLMTSAAEELLQELDSTEIQRPSIPVLSNVTGAFHGDAASIRTQLAQQLTRPVLWQRCIEALIAEKVEEFLEVGPGRVLTGLMRKIDRRANAVNVSTVEGLGFITPSGVDS